MKYTFGKNQAAQRLEDLLNTNPTARRKISRLLSDYTSKLLQVCATKDPSTVRLCMSLLRDHNLKRIDLLEDLTPDMRSYTRNVVISRHRVFRQEFDGINNLLEQMLFEKKLTFN